jgi:hypothetical protein
MKLTSKVLKGMIQEVIKESKENSMVLTEATYYSVKRKINEDHNSFFVVSAERTERDKDPDHPGKFRTNREATLALAKWLRSKGLSFTNVKGGYTELSQDPDTGKAQHYFSEEKSYLVIGPEPHYGDPQKAVTDIQALFDIAKEACMLDDKLPQEAFSFGYPQKVSSAFEEERTQMFIALFEPTAPSPAPSNAYTKWGGPWTSIDDMMKLTGAYTQVRGTRGAFAEQKLEEARKIEVNSVNDGRRRHHQIEYWTKLKNRWEDECKKK